MKESEKNQYSIDRRTFLSGAGVLAAAGIVGTVAGCSPQAAGSGTESGSDDANTDVTSSGISSGGVAADSTLPWLPAEPQIADVDIEEEVDVDVVVCGLGTAGVAAFRSAAEEGARVAAFEKADSPQARSGEYAVVNGDMMKEWGRDGLDPDYITEHEMDEMAYLAKRAILSRWAKNNAPVFDWWLNVKPGIYIASDSFSEIPESERDLYISPTYLPLPEAYHWQEERHPSIPASLRVEPENKVLLDKNMEFVAGQYNDAIPYYGHFVEKLIMDGGRCVGCYVRNAASGAYKKVVARKGVVLSCGEYSSNLDILNYYCPEVAENGVPNLWINFDVEGNPTNTGDGLKMGAWIGAAIQQHHAPMIHWMGANKGNTADQGTSGLDIQASVSGIMGTSPFIQLNKFGKRYMNEDVPGQQIENQLEMQPDRTTWMIWDSKWAEQVPFFPASHGNICYVMGEKPASNNPDGALTRKELDDAVAGGSCFKADSLEELLQALGGGIDVDEALKSIERYSALARSGYDEDFGKKASRMFPLENPPYYGASGGVSPLLVCLGGLESDEECRVYNNEREVIPGLYAAGNIQGNRYAVQYPIAFKGLSHSLCMYYGYVAGKNAVNGV
ncbi:MAG: FAD-binding protein [Coriobacteriales bacterium]|jgi:hypothetical protein|nr:FAD-binding protein [Coriobacteriales bacterium]